MARSLAIFFSLLLTCQLQVFAQEQAPSPVSAPSPQATAEVPHVGDAAQNNDADTSNLSPVQLLKSNAQNATNKNKKTGNWLTKIPSPKRVATTTVGFAIGTPIAVVRQSKREIVIATRDLVGDTKNPLLLAPAGVLGVPAGILSGCIYGTYAGIADSWTNSESHPFSKDFFSLGDLP